jgi:hypothetical protein
MENGWTWLLIRIVFISTFMKIYVPGVDPANVTILVHKKRTLSTFTCPSFKSKQLYQNSNLDTNVKQPATIKCMSKIQNIPNSMCESCKETSEQLTSHAIQ